MKKGVLYVIRPPKTYLKEPAWIFCLPVMHFITGLCQPYDQHEEDLTYASTIPKWWGIEAIKDIVDVFVNDGRHWQMYVFN
ncbi:hypothetical protein DPMN_054479 [Dreissena polymorpha]|uniref:Uncharacterized protein n=1 Tax=Dreissena polymorpha TaxID=45954 RepID=A0A9D4CNZ0_DREPO|nr:hypothetical protein DPMN_054479 [Dreissena polymorpha]